MTRWGWCGVVTCRQPSILTISYTTMEPGWLHWGSGSRWRFFFFFFFLWPAALPWSCLTAAAQQVIRSPRPSGCAASAPCPPLPQTCASGSSREALFPLHPSLYYSMCTLKASTRAPGRPRTGNRFMRFTILSAPLRLPYRRRSLFPVNLRMESGWTLRLGIGIISAQPAPRSEWVVGYRSSGGGSSESNSCWVHHWLPPPCRPADAMLFWEAALPHRQRSERADPVCLSARRLIKLHPGLWVPTVLPRYVPAGKKSSATGNTEGLWRLVSSTAGNVLRLRTYLAFCWGNSSV